MMLARPWTAREVTAFKTRHPDALKVGASDAPDGSQKKSYLGRTRAYRPVTKRAMMTMVKTCIVPCAPTAKK